jgi:hypothetical protein
MTIFEDWANPENPMMERIMSLVRAKPGIRRSDLIADLGITQNVAFYWTSRMAAMGKLRVDFSDNKVRFYPIGEE